MTLKFELGRDLYSVATHQVSSFCINHSEVIVFTTNKRADSVKYVQLVLLCYADIEPNTTHNRRV